MPVDLSVRVVEPDAVEKFEAQGIVASLILQEHAQVRLLSDLLVVLLESLHFLGFLKSY